MPPSRSTSATGPWRRTPTVNNASRPGDRRLGVPVVSKTTAEADANFGWLAHFAKLADVDRPAYFTEPAGSSPHLG